jgi:hypothetical protein
VLVEEDAHELRDGDRRMRVVELNGDLVGKIRPGVQRIPEMPPQDVAQ